jgi:hypothetical protein
VTFRARSPDGDKLLHCSREGAVRLYPFALCRLPARAAVCSKPIGRVLCGVTWGGRFRPSRIVGLCNTPRSELIHPGSCGIIERTSEVIRHADCKTHSTARCPADSRGWPVFATRSACRTGQYFLDGRWRRAIQRHAVRGCPDVFARITRPPRGLPARGRGTRACRLLQPASVGHAVGAVQVRVAAR